MEWKPSPAAFYGKSLGPGDASEHVRRKHRVCTEEKAAGYIVVVVVVVFFSFFF